MERVSAGDARWRCPLRSRPRRHLCDDHRSAAMTMVFAGACSHAPGITGRAERAEPVMREQFYRHYDMLHDALMEARPDALVVVAAEHFANFFMNNMPAFAIGIADRYSGPVEDPGWLGIPGTSVPRISAPSHKLIGENM